MRPSPPRNAFIGQDAGWCLRANRWGEWRGVRHFFAVVSRLGDGVFWYALMGALVLLDGLDGLVAAAHMAATGGAALLLYRRLKHWTRRPRPFAADLRIRIPMPGAVESLNVGAAAAVCLFEALRRKSA